MERKNDNSSTRADNTRVDNVEDNVSINLSVIFTKAIFFLVFISTFDYFALLCIAKFYVRDGINFLHTSVISLG